MRKKKIFITIFLIIFLMQAIIPIKVIAAPTNNQTTTNTEQNGNNMGTGMGAGTGTNTGSEGVIPPGTQTAPQSTGSIFDPNATWEWEYVDGQYGLFVPNNADYLESVPMIVWLHGNGDGLSGDESGLKSTSVPELFFNWPMEGFKAFILCPQSKASWQKPDESKITGIIDKVMAEYPIDPDNVVIMGHSAGAVGAVTMAVRHPDYFSKAVIMAGLSYETSAASIPTKCFAGSHDKTYVRYLETNLEPLYGSENCHIVEGASHGTITEAVFCDDSGQYFGVEGNGHSDLIEWLFDDVSLSENAYSDIVSPTTGLDSVTGLILEPAVEFFTFIVDSIMSVFSAVMTQDDLKFVMVDEDEIGSIPSSGTVGASYTIPDMDKYATVSGNLDFLKYPRFTYSAEELFAGKIDLLDINFIDGSNDNDDWLNIRTVISQWYQVLRMIAIIGLLSVLIYTGIKIILSSNTKEKAKYKEMIANWLMGIVLVFSMHYILAFILSIIEELSSFLHELAGAIQVNAGGVSFQTNLMGLARFQIQQQHFTAKVAYLVIYVALAVYTFKFTFVYLKRVLKMAFLTLIAPIVALTYPIDKANDGSAQGFEMWLREVIFNALLQPMHHILYYILVSSSLTLAANNPIYGIVALMFMSQAEKLLKQIFGFGKAKAGTVGGIAGAFTTGAVTSSLIRHVQDPLHPLNPRKASGKSSGGKSSSGNSDYYDEEGIDFNDDTTREEDLLNMNLRGGANDYNYTNWASLIQETEEDTWSFNRTASRQDMLDILDAYEDYGGYLGDIPDLDELDNEELGDLIQDRVIDNGGSIKNNIFIPLNVNEKPGEQQESAWSQFKEDHPTARGIENVAKTLVKPVWDMEKDTKYNGKRIAKSAITGITGASIGVAAAAVQAGISITDGKYNPIEGVATVAAGVAGVSTITQNAQNKKELDPQDKKAVEKYTEQWFNRDDIIDKYNTEFQGEGKKRRSRAARNYVTRGITDVNDQKQAMRFADLIQSERGLDEEEADKIAVATLQYKQGLVMNNNYGVLFDKKQREKYIGVKADTYIGSASKKSIIKLHNDLIENVRDFERANR